MEQLYTVGQVSKLKGVSPRMLHYYDKLGILVPRSVDPKTGYRRYTLDQMLELDAIKMCIDAGIPLAQLSAIQGREPKAAMMEILKEAQAKLASHIETLERTKLSIDDYLSEFNDSQNMLKDETSRPLSPNVAVALPWSLPKFDAKSYLDSMTTLEAACRQNGLARYLRRGLVFATKHQRAWTFIEVASVDELDDGSDVIVLQLPDGRYMGIEIEGESISEAFEKGFVQVAAKTDQANNRTPAFITLTERWGAGLGDIRSAVLLRVYERDSGFRP